MTRAKSKSRDKTVVAVGGNVPVLDVGTLEACEAVIAAAGTAVLDAGRALRAVRDGRLYGVEFSSFEGYCRDRWDMSREAADKMIRQAGVADVLLAERGVLPRSAYALTELAPRLNDPEGLLGVWDRVVDFAGGAGAVTGVMVRETLRAEGAEGGADSPESDSGVVDGTVESVSDESDSPPPAEELSGDALEAALREAISAEESEGDLSGLVEGEVTEESVGAAVLDQAVEQLLASLGEMRAVAERVRAAVTQISELGGVGGVSGGAGSDLADVLGAAREDTEMALVDAEELLDSDDEDDLPEPGPELEAGVWAGAGEREIELDDEGFPVMMTFSH